MVLVLNGLLLAGAPGGPRGDGAPSSRRQRAAAGCVGSWAAAVLRIRCVGALRAASRRQGHCPRRRRRMNVGRGAKTGGHPRQSRRNPQRTREGKWPPCDSSTTTSGSVGGRTGVVVGARLSPSPPSLILSASGFEGRGRAPLRLPWAEVRAGRERPTSSGPPVCRRGLQSFRKVWCQPPRHGGGSAARTPGGWRKKSCTLWFSHPLHLPQFCRPLQGG
ncbi:uncharacterized protein LOC124162513 [Ischnura elegans]|uniref:uncharacterized protein LOC124162513 n=1 Tax=Ischnura elegans TaxID=197161 RepID=UPI001ED891EB|nr:uncharacterized protein LOC124162513 [Ischnura elegans]